MRGSGEGRRDISLIQGEDGSRLRGTTGDRGQATVEMALILPLLVLCIAGIVWVGQVMSMFVRVEHAAREGARAAAVEPAAATLVAQEAVGRSLPDASVSASVSAEFVAVTVTVAVDGVPIINIGGRTVEAEAHMRREDIINGPLRSGRSCWA